MFLSSYLNHDGRFICAVLFKLHRHYLIILINRLHEEVLVCVDSRRHNPVGGTMLSNLFSVLTGYWLGVDKEAVVGLFTSNKIKGKGSTHQRYSTSPNHPLVY